MILSKKFYLVAALVAVVVSNFSNLMAGSGNSTAKRNFISDNHRTFTLSAHKNAFDLILKDMNEEVDTVVFLESSIKSGFEHVLDALSYAVSRPSIKRIWFIPVEGNGAVVKLSGKIKKIFSASKFTLFGENDPSCRGSLVFIR